MNNIDNNENGIKDKSCLDDKWLLDILNQKTPLEKEVEDMIHQILEKDRLLLEEACRDMEKMESGPAESACG